MKTLILMAFWVALLLAFVPGQQSNDLDSAALSPQRWGAGTASYPPITSVRFEPGVTNTVAVQGAVNQPFFLATAGQLVEPGLPVLGGLLDIELSSLVIVLDGTIDPSINTGPGGYWSTGVTVPLGSPVSNLFAQALVIDPASAAGARLSAALAGRIGPGPSPSVTTYPLTLGDDTSQYVDLSAHGIEIPFYGQLYSGLYVNSNGNVTFGAPSSNPSPSVASFLAGPPMIAAQWTDLAPHIAGTITAVVDQSLGTDRVIMTWLGVPEKISGVTHTATIRLGFGERFRVITGAPPSNLSPSQLTIFGTSPGMGLSGPVLGTGNIHILSFDGMAGPANQAWYEVSSGAFSLSGTSLSLWDLNATVPAAYHAAWQ